MSQLPQVTKATAKLLDNPKKKGLTKHFAGLVERVLERDAEGRIISVLARTQDGKAVRLYGEGLMSLAQQSRDGLRRGDQVTVYGQVARNPVFKKIDEFYVPEKPSLISRLEQNFSSHFYKASWKVDKSLYRAGYKFYNRIGQSLAKWQGKKRPTNIDPTKYHKTLYKVGNTILRFPIIAFSTLTSIVSSYGRNGAQKRPWEVTKDVLAETRNGKVLRPYHPNLSPNVAFAVELAEQSAMKSLPIYFLDPVASQWELKKAPFEEQLESVDDLSHQMTDALEKGMVFSRMENRLINYWCDYITLEPHTFRLRNQRDMGVDASQKIVIPFHPWTFGGLFSYQSLGNLPRDSFFSKKIPNIDVFEKFVAAHETAHALSPMPLGNYSLNEEILADCFSIMALLRENVDQTEIRNILLSRITGSFLTATEHDTGFAGMKFLDHARVLKVNGKLDAMTTDEMMQEALSFSYGDAAIGEMLAVRSEIYQKLHQGMNLKRSQKVTPAFIEEVYDHYKQGLKEGAYSTQAVPYVQQMVSSLRELYYLPSEIEKPHIQNEIMMTYFDGLMSWMEKYGDRKDLLRGLGNQISRYLTGDHLDETKASKAFKSEFKDILLAEIEDAYNQAEAYIADEHDIVVTQTSGKSFIEAAWTAPLADRLRMLSFVATTTHEKWKKVHAPFASLTEGTDKELSKQLENTLTETVGVGIEQKINIQHAEQSSALATEVACSILFSPEGQDYLASEAGKKVRPLVEHLVEGGWQNMRNPYNDITKAGAKFSEKLEKLVSFLPKIEQKRQQPQPQPRL